MRIGSFRLIDCNVYVDNELIYSGRLEDASDEIRKMNYYKYEFKAGIFSFWVNSKESDELNKEFDVNEIAYKNFLKEHYNIKDDNDEEVIANTNQKPNPLVTKNDYVKALLSMPKNKDFSDKDFKDMTEYEQTAEIEKFLFSESLRGGTGGGPSDWAEQQYSHSIDND